jgi:hypothetical protein
MYLAFSYKSVNVIAVPFKVGQYINQTDVTHANVRRPKVIASAQRYFFNHARGYFRPRTSFMEYNPGFLPCKKRSAASAPLAKVSRLVA